MKPLQIVFLLIAALIVGSIIYNVFFVSDETRIARTLENGRKAFGGRRLLRFAALLSNRYQDDYGYDKGSLIRAVKYFYDQHRHVDAKFSSLRIHLLEPQNEEKLGVADVRIHFTGDIAGVSYQGVEIGRRDGVEVRIYVAKEGRSWKVRRFEMKK